MNRTQLSAGCLALVCTLVPPLFLAACSGGGGGGSRAVSSGTPVRFVSRRDVPIRGTGSADLALADLDGDGDLDLVTANFDLAGNPAVDGLEVLRNEGGGGFTSLQLLTACGAPFAVGLADLDADGFTDLYGSCRLSGRLLAWFGDGSGSFPQAPDAVVDPGLGAGAVLEVVEFDADGDDLLDLVATDIQSGLLFLTRALPGRSFAAPEQISLAAFPGARPTGLGAGDLDGDGDVDLVACDFRGGRLLLLSNDGAGHFTASSSPSTRAEPLDVEVVDRDGDGDLDLLVGHFSGAAALVFDGDGAGGFAAPLELIASGPVLGVSLVDFDRDGVLDLLSAAFQDSAAEIRRGLPGGGYSEPVAYAVGFHPRRVRGADLDGDGQPELLSANFEDPSISLVVRDSEGAVDAPRCFEIGRFPFYVAVEDFDGQPGYEVASSVYEEGRIDFQAVGPDGVLTPLGSVALPAPIRPNFLRAVDLDGDRDLDLVVANAEGNQVVTLFNDGVLPFGRFVVHATSGFQLLGMAAGDFDRDGDLDLGVASTGSDSVLILANDGTGGLSEVGRVRVGGSPAAVAAADFDQDGDLDLAISEIDENALHFLANDGTGTFVSRARSSTGLGPTFLAVGDVDDDALPDLFVACSGSEFATRLRNTGGFTFVRSQFPLGPGANFLDLVDLDRDGDQDLVAIPRSGEGRVFLGDGRGGFVDRSDLGFLTVRSVSHAAIRDLDGDRALDLLVASYESRRLVVAKGAPVR